MPSSRRRQRAKHFPEIAFAELIFHILICHFKEQHMSHSEEFFSLAISAVDLVTSLTFSLISSPLPAALMKASCCSSLSNGKSLEKTSLCIPNMADISTKLRPLSSLFPSLLNELDTVSLSPVLLNLPSLLMLFILPLTRTVYK